MTGKFEEYPKYFYFRKPPKEASYFNFKVYNIEQGLKQVESKKEEIADECDEILDCIDDSAEYHNEIGAKLTKYDISEVYKLSKVIFNLLKSCQVAPIKAPQLAFLSLKDVESFFRELFKTLKEYSSKIEVSLNIINDLIKNEKNLNSAKNIILSKISNLKGFFEGYESETKIIENIASKIEEIDNKYKSICQSGQSLGENIKGIDEFNKVAREKLNELSDLIKLLDEIDDELKEICQERINHIEVYHSSITKMLDVLKEAGEDATALKKAFKQIAEDAIGYLNSLSLGNTVKVKWREIEEDLSSLKKQLLDRVKRILSEEEFEVLLLIVEKATTKRWLAFPEIIDDISSTLIKEPKQVSEIIERLADKKLLKKGISLPIEFS